MGATFGDYFSSPAFDPGVMAFRGWQAEKHLWYNTPDPTDGPLTGLYLPALPVIGYQQPTPTLYASTVDALVAYDSSRRRSDTQSLWEALGMQSLQRSPELSPVWTDLLARSGGTSVSEAVWSDFRRSDLYPWTTQTLAMQASQVSGRATKTLTRVVARGGRLVLKVAGWLFSLPNPTPAGVAVAVIKQVGQEVALDLAAAGGAC